MKKKLQRLAALFVLVFVGVETLRTYGLSFGWFLGMAISGALLFLMTVEHRCCPATGAPVSTFVKCRCGCHPDPNRPPSPGPYQPPRHVDVGSSYSGSNAPNYSKGPGYPTNAQTGYGRYSTYKNGR
ncbi:hypothetical protein [Actinomycetospora lemnae]|uniref:Uncharacterized protein n=1 Tax=Actinomycetospora lemnae TaxID=3019891 RepID=A0ABT5SUN4_9PSEU|nr:hypothetical protein [Actinomycetospora sp. DW7H6]MDD7966569.1 hypothetical protein [Actinomycetospora sp. DW7H6]